MSRTKTITVVLCFVSCIHFEGNCFNLDTTFPIIYGDDRASQRPSYYGFTVLLHEPDSWVQIGAPRSNSSFPALRAVNEPGVVYRCSFKKPCKEILLEDHGNGVPESAACTNDVKDHAWIGGAMAAEPGPNGRVVMCGHGWKNAYHLNRKKDVTEPGMCYWMYANHNNDTRRLTPTVTTNIYNCYEDVLYTHAYGIKAYYYGFSQAGFSVHITPDTKESGMIIGAPGLLNWKGGVVKYEDEKVHASGGRAKRSTDFRTFKEPPTILNPHISRDVNNFDLFGYQVTSGKFFNNFETIYAASSPHGSHFTGHVLLLTFPEYLNSESIWIKRGQLFGKEMGESFGYSLAVGDITGDGLDDLIVGAPTFSDNNEKRDAGRIFVFLGSRRNILVDPIDGKTIEGVNIDARFGSTVASVGDLDQDGYADIAVGAPYENDNRGAIYIYNGSPGGLKVPHSQYIRAADIDEGLRGFGVSISPPADLDGNHFKDIAVGAFLSGQVVILRTYPVVMLDLWFEKSVAQLLMNITTITMSACQKYSGRNAPQTIRVLRTITADERYGRATLNVRKVEELSLNLNIPQCQFVQITFKHDITNWRDIELRMYHELAHSSPEKSIIWINGSSPDIGPDHFCGNCPIVQEKLSKMETTVTLPYARDCAGTICFSRLRLSCHLNDAETDTSLNNIYVLGSRKNIIQYKMSVENNGEPAYSAYVNFTLPLYVHIASLPQDCQEERGKYDSLFIICYFRTPIVKNIPVDMVLSLDMRSLDRYMNETTGLVPPVIFRSSVNSTSHEADGDENNFCETQLNVNIDADFEIKGQSVQPIYTYTKKTEHKNKVKDIQFFMQKYQVKKFGDSPVKMVYIELTLPKEWKTASGRNISFLELKSLEMTKMKPHISCQSETHYVPDSESKQTDSYWSGGYIQSKVSINQRNDGDDELEQRDQIYNYPSNRSLYLNCSNPNVQCVTHICTADEFQYNDADFELQMLLNVSNLEPFMGGKDVIYVTTQGRLKLSTTHINSRGPHFVAVSSVIKINEPKQTIALWIYIVSIVAGLLLFLLLIAGLVKAGFFQRKKKEELQALKNANES